MKHNPPTDPASTLLDVTTAARRLSVGRTTLFALLRTGELASIQIGALRRIPLAAIQAYIQRKTTENHENHA